MTDTSSTSSASPRSGRKPTAFRLDDRNVRLTEDPAAVPDNDEALIAALEEETETPRLPATASSPKSAFGFGKWIAIGFGGLVSLAAGLAVDALIRDLFSKTEWLGWVGIGLATLAALGLAGFILRELLGLLRLGKIDHLRAALAKAAEEDDARAAGHHLKELMALYQDRPETARGRKQLTGHMREIIDGRDLVVLAERDLLRPLDLEAKRIVMNSAKRVSLVTAVSPRALIDLLAVLIENMRTIRRVAALYGGRPGTLGFLRLARQIATHLALTGGMAAGDSLASQILGHGLAARLSARLGEGVINGLLTSRIGIAAIAVCRPAPFIDTKGPSVTEFMTELLNTGDRKTEEKTEDSNKK